MKTFFLSFLSALLLDSMSPAIGAEQHKPSPCRYVQVATSAIRYAGYDMSPSMQASINGKPATMLVDTGAFATFLTRAGARRHKLELFTSSHEVEGISGISKVYTANIDRLSTGPGDTVATTMPVLADMAGMPSWDGLVGAHFLFQTDLEFNLAAKEMKFFRPLDCRTAHLAYWDPNAIVVPMGYWSSKRKTPYFTVEINGKKLKAIIDSGAGTSGITLEGARAAGIDMAGPKVRAAGHTGGVGKAKVRQWIVHVDTVRIGDELIRDTDLSVFDSQADGLPDVLLGEDFLRSHRVLFAMSQRKIYFSHLGGDTFTRHGSVEPWLLREAEEGNADARFHLALRYQAARGMPKNEEASRNWLERAAALGHPEANLRTGYQQLQARNYTDAAKRLRIALDAFPDSRYLALGLDSRDLALGLHAARLGSREPALAREELVRFVGNYEADDWLAPVYDHFLGKIDATEMLARAALHRTDGAERVCETRSHARTRLTALGDSAGAQAMTDPRCQSNAGVATATPGP